MELNSIQTPIEELRLDTYPKEIQDQFWDFFNSIPFIKNLTSVDRKRAKDLKRDESGKILVDITNPHILEDTDYFRPTAIHFQKTGRFTDLKPNGNKNSEYYKWVMEEVRRCREGYVRESDGEWITGDYYFFLNYCPMLVSVSEKNSKEKKKSKAKRVLSFPSFWEGHYLITHYLNKARQQGRHAAELSSRGRGKTYVGASLLTKRFELGESEDVNREVQCVVTAQERKFISGANQILDIFKKNIDFLAMNTEFPSKKLVNSLQSLQWVMGYKDLDTDANKGTLNSVIGITSKDDESKLRGSRGVLYLIEEAGTFARLLNLYSNIRPSVEDGDKVFGLIFAYGCVCSGTKVIKPNGMPVNIEDVSIIDNLLGYVGGSSTIETIRWLSPIGYKDCVHIKTEKENELRCSKDHPLLAVNKDSSGNNLATCSFYKAEELRVGDTLIIPKKIGYFGNDQEPNAFLLGKLFRRNSNKYKTIPNEVFDWGREFTCEFLSGYFTAGCSVVATKTKCFIKTKSKSKDNLESIKALLLKFGICSYIVSDLNYFVLYISEPEDIVLFRDNIKILVKSKMDKLYSINISTNINSFRFKLRDNCKGENLIGRTIDNVQLVTIKSIEDIGVQRIYNMTASTTHTYISNGFISSNTAGDSESDFSSMQELMYNPQGYNILALPNVYDKTGQGKKEFSFFFPGYMNMANCYDEDGNSDVTRALLSILIDRYTVKYNSSDINAVTRRIAEIPITPQEAIVRTEGNFFPVSELNERLNQIDNNPRFYDDTLTGTLVTDGDNVKFVPTTDIPIRDFPTKDNKQLGAIEIYELPEKDSSGKPTYGRYIIGHDPVDDDSSDTMSLTSTFVFDLFTDQIVAEYTGRQPLANDNFEIVRKLCVFYNAKCLYESNKKGIYAYFEMMHCSYLLADTPEYLKEKNLITAIGTGNKSKGVNASLPINNYANSLIRNWMLKPITHQQKVKEDNDGIVTENIIEVSTFNLYNIKNRALIREAILFNATGNFDRIRALGMVMLYREEYLILYGGDAKSGISNNISNYDDYLGNDTFFTSLYDKNR